MSTTSDSVLEVTGLTKLFGRLQVLTDVTFRVQEGEVVGVLGRSGSGKSTLLRCIDLLEPANAGNITYMGKVRAESLVGRWSVNDLDNGAPSTGGAVGIRRNLGLVFQNYNLWDDRTVLTNLTLAPVVVAGENRASAESRARALAKRFGLADKLRERAWRLSGGQRQRVAILRALMMNPKLLMLDEVTAALDPATAFEIMTLIRELKRDGVAMIIVTHQFRFAQSACDRILFLDEGRIAQDDNPAAFVAAPATQSIRDYLTILSEAV